MKSFVRHVPVTTTTGTYAHLAIEDLRDAVNKIGCEHVQCLPIQVRDR